jgi:hypothetical protein
MLTPHIAGSVGDECRRMAKYMVEELERYVNGRPLKWALTKDGISNSVHGPAASEKGSVTVQFRKKTVRKVSEADSVLS